MLFMSLISDNIHVYMYIKKCKRNQLHYSVFSKSGKNDIRKHWKTSLVFNEIYRGKNIYLRTFWHVKQIVPVPLPCLQPIDDMGRDRNTCSRAKVAFGICWQSVHIHIVNMIPWYIIKHYLQKHSKFCTSTVILLLFTFIFYR